jgi:hypothetical protein
MMAWPGRELILGAMHFANWYPLQTDLKKLTAHGV